MRAGEFNTGDVVPGTRYRVMGLVGSGGMGLVYDVEHLELGKRFVLKALLSDLAGREDIVARLRNEQRALGRLQHPNIVAVTDAGVTSTGIPFFVMERLEGETLSARLKRARRLPVLEALALARGVLEGLSAAHEIGVVHRDIKPQNIFLASGSRPKILDFGVAKVADAASVITARGVAIGTPRYMSPEQVGGEAVDGRSDLYAVGLLLFESIAGRGPFDDARDANEMLLAHLGKVAPRLGGFSAGVTRELDALVASLLAKSPSERPPTARAAVAALAAVAGRYGGGANLDAPTPHSSYSSTTHSLGARSAGTSAIATRPDGVAARDPATMPNPSSHGTTQVMPHAVRDDATSVDEPGAGSTLYDPSSRLVTVAQSQFAVPIDAVRTERLETVALPALADEPTHTRVPSTPSDGTPSLVAVRVERPAPPRPRAFVPWLAGAALIALFGGAYALVRARAAASAGVPSEPASAVSSQGPSEPQRAADPSPASPAFVERNASSTVNAAPVLATPAPTASTPPVARPKSSAESGAKPESSEGEPSSRPGVSASSSKRAPNAAPSATLPPGLPSSGL